MGWRSIRVRRAVLALALVFALPGVVALAAIGANVYWISLMLKLRDLLHEPQAAVAQ